MESPKDRPAAGHKAQSQRSGASVVFAAQDMLPGGPGMPGMVRSETIGKSTGEGYAAWSLRDGFGLSGWMRLRTLVLIRWIAILGQASTVLIATHFLDLPVPLLACMAVIGLSALANLFLTLHRHGAARLGDQAAAIYLAFDLLQLAALLYLTGGLENPFALLVLAPVTVSASILSTRSTISLTVLAVILASLLAMFHMPPPFSEDSRLFGHSLYSVGLWAALIVTVMFIAAYVWHVSADARNMAAALTVTQMALAREQRLSSMGALAAAVTHELGSPLGAILMTARELQNDIPPGSPHTEDVDMIVSQGVRCREILAELARGEPRSGTCFIPLPLGALVEDTAAPYQSDRIPVLIEREPMGEEAGPEPKAPFLPEIRHAIATLIENATQFSRDLVEVTIAWDAEEAQVIIQDDGPGFSPEMLDRLGEPYISGRKGRGTHMGLGVFIAQTLLNRTGASVTFANAGEAGQESDMAGVIPGDRTAATTSLADGGEGQVPGARQPEDSSDDLEDLDNLTGARITIVWKKSTLEELAELQRQQDQWERDRNG